MRSALAAIAAALILEGCAGTAAPSAAASPDLWTSTPLVVVYELDGSATSADITYETPTGSSQQQGVDVPMKTEDGEKGIQITGFSPGAFLYISAQNANDYGDLTCRIRVGGAVVSENTATGEYAITTCQSRL